jgi:hypothetical protein
MSRCAALLLVTLATHFSRPARASGQEEGPPGGRPPPETSAVAAGKAFSRFAGDRTIIGMAQALMKTRGENQGQKIGWD